MQQTTSDKLISVIIPFHNRFDKVLRAINSVLKQTYKDFEIIAVDDFSDREHFELKKIERVEIKIIRNQINLGPGGSRNTGLNYAVGKYVAFLDSDDFWASTFLEKTFSVLESNRDLAFVYGLTMEVAEREFKKIRRENNEAFSEILPVILEKGRPWCTSACLWNRKVLDKIGKWKNCRTWEDYEFDIRAAIECNEIGCVEEVLVFYETTGEDKLSFYPTKQYLQQKAESLKMISFNLFNSKFKTSKKIIKPIVRHLKSNSLQLIKEGNPNEAFRLLLEIIKWKNKDYKLTIILIRFILHLPQKLQLRIFNRIF